MLVPGEVGTLLLVPNPKDNLDHVKLHLKIQYDGVSESGLTVKLEKTIHGMEDLTKEGQDDKLEGLRKVDLGNTPIDLNKG